MVIIEIQREVTTWGFEYPSGHCGQFRVSSVMSIRFLLTDPRGLNLIKGDASQALPQGRTWQFDEVNKMISLPPFSSESHLRPVTLCYVLSEDSQHRLVMAMFLHWGNTIQCNLLKHIVLCILRSHCNSSVVCSDHLFFIIGNWIIEWLFDLQYADVVFNPRPWATSRHACHLGCRNARGDCY